MEPNLIDTFTRFFESLGYGVTYEGRQATGERWHEIYDTAGIICQVSFGTPLGEFLADLPYLVEGKSGLGPTDYWCACKDSEKLRELLARVQAAKVSARWGGSFLPMKNQISPFDMVRQFHAKVGQIDAATPSISEHRELRINLITEEFRELREALEASNIVGVSHELADLLYVVIGSALQWGIPIERVLSEVHRSNMTKEGDAKRADGKILKGPNYSPPDIAGVLAGAGDEPSRVFSGPSMGALRFYIRVPGCRFWCVPIRAVEGQSIETYCNGRSPQSEPVEIATEPSIWERCAACELAADVTQRPVAGRAP